MTLGLLLALPATGWAWEHEGIAWPDVPIAWEVSNDTVSGLPSGYTAQAIAQAFDAWTDHDCLDVTSTGGTTAGDNPGVSADGRSVFSMNDPFDQVPAGSWAVTVTEVGTGILFTQEGVDYRVILEADVVFSDSVDFATDAAIAAGCGDEVSFAAVATHEVGHVLGLADACPRPETCDDQAIEEATMHWLVAPCDTGSSTLAQDDLQGIAALYGPYVPFRCTPEQEVEGRPAVAGLVPFAADCAIDEAASADVDDVAWDFGDGGGGSSEAASHTYTVPGRYDVTACVDAPTLQACSLFEACPTKAGYAIACTPPAISIGWDVVEGATIQLVNDTPIPAEGCFDTVLWTLYDGAGTVLDTIEEWEPVYTFPGPGDYRAVLEIDGPAGYATAETQPHVSGTAGDDTGAPDPICGCSSTGFAGMHPLALLLLATCRSRRRG